MDYVVHFRDQKDDLNQISHLSLANLMITHLNTLMITLLSLISNKKRLCLFNTHLNIYLEHQHSLIVRCCWTLYQEVDHKTAAVFTVPLPLRVTELYHCIKLNSM